MRPYSRGQIKLRSSNPLLQPSIDANYLSDPRDVQVLIEGKKTRNISKFWLDGISDLRYQYCNMK